MKVEFNQRMKVLDEYNIKDFNESVFSRYQILELNYHPYSEEIKNLPVIESWNLTKFTSKYMKIDIVFSNASLVSIGPYNDIVSIKFLNRNIFLTMFGNKTI